MFCWLDIIARFLFNAETVTHNTPERDKMRSSLKNLINDVEKKLAELDAQGHDVAESSVLSLVNRKICYQNVPIEEHVLGEALALYIPEMVGSLLQDNPYHKEDLIESELTVLMLIFNS